MKLVILPALLALTVTFAAGQKTEKVTMTGSVTGVKVEKDRQGKHFYRIQLSLSVRNDSGQRLILFQPTNLRLLGGTSAVDFIGKVSDAVDTSVSAGQRPNPSNPTFGPDDWDYVLHYLKGLESQEPGISGFYSVFVEPGGYFEFSDSIAVSNGFTLQPSIDDPKKPEAKPDFRALKVKYLLKVTRPQVSDDLFKQLQRKWSASGHLLLNSEGNFSLVSEEIPLILAK